MPFRPTSTASSACASRFRQRLSWVIRDIPIRRREAPADGPSPALVHFRRYLLAQYSLAPLLLVENTTPEFVIGNYEPGAEPPPPAGFHQAADFGDGLVLFRRTEP